MWVKNPLDAMGICCNPHINSYGLMEALDTFYVSNGWLSVNKHSKCQMVNCPSHECIIITTHNLANMEKICEKNKTVTYIQCAATLYYNVLFLYICSALAGRGTEVKGPGRRQRFSQPHSPQEVLHDQHRHRSPRLQQRSTETPVLSGDYIEHMYTSSSTRVQGKASKSTAPRALKELPWVGIKPGPLSTLDLSY